MTGTRQWINGKLWSFITITTIEYIPLQGLKNCNYKIIGHVQKNNNIFRPKA